MHSEETSSVITIWNIKTNIYIWEKNTSHGLVAQNFLMQEMIQLFIFFKGKSLRCAFFFSAVMCKTKRLLEEIWKESSFYSCICIVLEKRSISMNLSNTHSTQDEWEGAFFLKKKKHSLADKRPDRHISYSLVSRHSERRMKRMCKKENHCSTVSWGFY